MQQEPLSLIEACKLALAFLQQKTHVEAIPLETLLQEALSKAQGK